MSGMYLGKIQTKDNWEGSIWLDEEKQNLTCNRNGKVRYVKWQSLLRTVLDLYYTWESYKSTPKTAKNKNENMLKILEYSHQWPMRKRVKCWDDKINIRLNYIKIID